MSIKSLTRKALNDPSIEVGRTIWFKLTQAGTIPNTPVSYPHVLGMFAREVKAFIDPSLVADLDDLSIITNYAPLLKKIIDDNATNFVSDVAVTLLNLGSI